MAVTAIVASSFPSSQHLISSSSSSCPHRASKARTPLLQSSRGSIATCSSSSFVGEKLFLGGGINQSIRECSLWRKLIFVPPKVVSELSDSEAYLDSPTGEVFGYASAEPRNTSAARKYDRHPQNVDLPPVLPKKKKKPYPIPIHKVLRSARNDKKLAHMGVEKHLEPPKNGLLVPELIPVAYQTLESWKVLIEGLAQLLTVVPVYGCRECPEVYVGSTGHLIQDCSGPQNVKRRSRHVWVRGTINDVLIPTEAYHLFDPFGHRIKHETRFNYERIPAVVELCIQAGVELSQYPSRRRSIPVRMLGKKVIDRGGFAEEPKPCRSQDAMALLSEIDTYAVLNGQFMSPPADTRKAAERTLKAYSTVRSGVRQLMKKYTVKACGYCSEVHVGPWGHNAKLCGAFKHQWRDGKHGWQDATIDEVIPPNFVWHLKEPKGPPPTGALKRFYGKAPAVVEVCVQAGAEIPDAYRPMMRLDIVVPEAEEARLVA
ncbi:APO protein 1, chloroplastic [Dendrobium catenatum]|uniref:APO protein 1, chloroplastic n=1 Tax=Dendrobium catenatum TaxID=906689 RepID=A0A2I0VB38_9ASPA|nr:APO protein 1, chloroplastic [Dendrobium catenatum]PKU60617.1 APO protein 1, chloroplastic [Dendrobium catenatum]